MQPDPLAPSRAAGIALIACLLLGCGPVRPPSPSAPTLPGGLVDIGGGRRLDVACSGSAGSVVILESGLGNTSEVWLGVVQRVRAFATVCTYDRAGLGRSDPRPEPHGAGSAVDDLRAVLAAAKLPAPYVLVGASYGGLVTQLYARRYPSDVAGVVLVDSLAAAWDRELEALLTPDQVAERRAIPNGEPLTNEDIRASEDAVAAGPPFPSVPLVVLRHGRPFEVGPGWPRVEIEALWASLAANLAKLSPTSTLLLAAQSGHRIQQDQPQLVADAIHAIVDPSRWPPSAPPSPEAFGEGAPAVAAGELDGRLIFSAGDGLHIANADGSNDRVILADPDHVLGEPTADASGRWLAYTRRDRPAAAGGSSGPQPEQPAELWLLDLASGATARVAGNAQLPAIAPDGSLVAFSRTGHTFVVAPDGSGLRDLGEAGCPVWSPDSLRLALCTTKDAVFILTLADGGITPIIAGGGPSDPTAWSPDGQTLALYSGRDGDGEIYLIETDSSSERRLTMAAGNQVALGWLPAGLLVTSSLPDAAESDWFLVDPSTRSPRSIPWLTGVPNPVAWLPAAP